MSPIFRAAAGAGMLVLASVSFASACPAWRARVAVAADRNAVLIADFARPAAIAELAAIAAPAYPAARPDARHAPVELTLYTVSGTLGAIDRLPDGGYRLAIADRSEPATMIAVAPDPGCAAASRFAANIRAVRRAIDRQFGQFRALAPNLPVTATGIAFFAERGREAGAATNGVELSPLIGIAFP
jgi:hypothetical protein